MPSLADLRASAFESAVPVREPSPVQASRSVGWVRLMRARVPAFEALESGDVVIIPGSALAVVAPDPPTIAELAAGLAGADVAAVVLLGPQPALDDLARAADAAGLAAFQLDGIEPAAIERAITSVLVGPTAMPDTPAGRLLAALTHLPDGPRLAAALLEPVLQGRPDVQQARMETLRAVLERGGATEAATVLGVHRNTVAYRLAAIERATSWDLRDPDLRLALLVALRIAGPRGPRG